MESRSPANRSLERGMLILRAFRPGSTLLANGELAERTGLARATVSRLTQTLVAGGFLQHDARARAYRLGPPVLSLAYAMRQGSDILGVALPLMREIAETRRINVGLAAADGEEMVYLESVRRHRGSAFRHITAGSRIPMELTSLGHAHLATLTKAQLEKLLAQFRARRGAQWPVLLKEIKTALVSVERHGYCRASWQPGVIALASPLRLPEQGGYVMNISLSNQQMSDAEIRTDLAPLLKKLVGEVAVRLA
jgi:DNA-binding IclR family transcriptional regulator